MDTLGYAAECRLYVDDVSAHTQIKPPTPERAGKFSSGKAGNVQCGSGSIKPNSLKSVTMASIAESDSGWGVSASDASAQAASAFNVQGASRMRLNICIAADARWCVSPDAES